MEKLLITPKTKIHDLLETYPELEKLLVSMAPEFRKLRNPILRKTIARITNISQAAIIGKLNVEELVNKLREKVGQSNLEHSNYSEANYVTTCPEWFQSKLIVNTIDVGEMLNKGEQPVHEVLSAIKKLKTSEILEIKAPFIPAPLLDKTISLEYKHWINKIVGNEYKIYFSL